MGEWRIDGLCAEGPDGVSVDMDTLEGETIVEHLERDDCGGNYSVRATVPNEVLRALLRNKRHQDPEALWGDCDNCEIRRLAPLSPPGLDECTGCGTREERDAATVQVKKLTMQLEQQDAIIASVRRKVEATSISTLESAVDHVIACRDSARAMCNGTSPVCPHCDPSCPHLHLPQDGMDCAVCESDVRRQQDETRVSKPLEFYDDPPPTTLEPPPCEVAAAIRAGGK